MEREDYQKVNELVRKIQEGNEKAFEELLKQYEGLIVNIANKYFDRKKYDWRSWVDHLQGTFYIYAIEYDFSRGVYFSTYLSKKLSSYALYTVSKVDGDHIEDLPYDVRHAILEHFSPGLQKYQNYKVFSILENLQQILKEEDFRILYLYYYEGYTQSEVAEKFGRSQFWCWWRLKKIKEDVKELLSK